MPHWLGIVVVIVGVLAAGLVRERWRLRSLARIARQRSFVLHSPVALFERPPLAALAERSAGRPATRWGAGLTGKVNGLEIAIAEHELPARGVDATGSPDTIGIWHVIVAWPVGRTGGSTDPVGSWPPRGRTLSQARRNEMRICAAMNGFVPHHFVQEPTLSFRQTQTQSPQRPIRTLLSRTRYLPPLSSNQDPVKIETRARVIRLTSSPPRGEDGLSRFQNAVSPPFKCLLCGDESLGILF